ncbi:MAG: hypothetical protein AAB874_00735 [Patescibacteria group bacterium]
MKHRTSIIQGFSLIELLAGISLTGMIFLGSTSLMFALFNSNSRVKQLDILEQTKNDLQVELSNQVRWAKTVNILSPQQLDIEATNGEVISYRCDLAAKNFLKNESTLTPKQVVISNCTIRNFSRTISHIPVSLELLIEMHHKEFIAVKDTLRLVVSQRVGTNN